MKTKILKAKLLRFLKITKPIELSKYEIQWIKFSKFHYKDKYPMTGTWIESAKDLFIEIYGWNPDEDNNYKDYLNCLFIKLLEIHLKIVSDHSGSNLQLRNIFDAAFYKGISNNAELPIERAICTLFGLIQNNTVIENGVNRYYLNENK